MKCKLELNAFICARDQAFRSDRDYLIFWLIACSVFKYPYMVLGWFIAVGLTKRFWRPERVSSLRGVIRQFSPTFNFSRKTIMSSLSVWLHWTVVLNVEEKNKYVVFQVENSLETRIWIKNKEQEWKPRSLLKMYTYTACCYYNTNSACVANKTRKKKKKKKETENRRELWECIVCIWGVLYSRKFHSLKHLCLSQSYV